MAARYIDGEFQINAGTNSSRGRLKVYAMLGVCPYEQLNVNMEFSLIDEVSKAIMILSCNNGIILPPPIWYNEKIFYGRIFMGVIIDCNAEAEYIKTQLNFWQGETKNGDLCAARAGLRRC